MKLAIMQPYFMPYIGYFQLINTTDKWIIYDTVQYINHGWMNRNRILHPTPETGWQYITIPIKKHSLSTKIKDIEINSNEKWQQRILGQLNHYKRKAEYFNQAVDMVSECLEIKENSLSKFNASVLSIICKKLDINFDYLFSSELELSFNDMSNAEDKVLAISKHLDATEYINLIGGLELYNFNTFENNNIKLSFLKSIPFEYKQHEREYIPYLSILDLFMFNSIYEIKEYIKNYEIVSG